MDRNSAIGLTLIAVLLLIYFNFLAPTPQPETCTARTSHITTCRRVQLPLMLSFNPIKSTVHQYNNMVRFLLSFLAMKTETNIENNDLRITLSNKGYLKDIELKNFKTYSQKPLFLCKKRKQ